MTDYSCLEFSQFNAQALKKYNIDLKSFDKNHDSRIDEQELGCLLSTGKISHVSKLLTKETISQKVKNIEKELNNIKNNSFKYLVSSGLIGGAFGAGATGLSGVATVLSTTAALATGGVAALVVGAAGYFTMKAMLNDKQKLLEAELDNYKIALQQM